MSGFEPTDSAPPPGDKAQPNYGYTEADGMGIRQLAMAKDGHRYVFDYSPGQEPELLDRLVHLAHDPECALGMFDAAVLSHQIGISLSKQVGEMLRS